MINFIKKLINKLAYLLEPVYEEKITQQEKDDDTRLG